VNLYFLQSERRIYSAKNILKEGGNDNHVSNSEHCRNFDIGGLFSANNLKREIQHFGRKTEKEKYNLRAYNDGILQKY
jgi:hypothetical protein